MGIRSRIARLIEGDRYDKQVTELTDLMMRAYRYAPASMRPEEMIRRLGEVDPQYLDFVMRTMFQYIPVGTGSADAARTSLIAESRNMYTSDVLTGHIVDLWTDFGFGLEVNVTPRDEDAGELWQEFWTAPRNAPVLNPRKIHTNSINLLNDGEVFFVFFISKLDGQVTIRTIHADQMVERITDPEDDNVVLYWKRQYNKKNGGDKVTVYYADWTATEEADRNRVKLPEDAILADTLREETKVVVLPVLFKELKGRGNPLMSAAFGWSRVYRDFLQDRAAVARAVASIVDKIKIKGGQRAVDAFRQQFESTLASMDRGIETNPPPVAGSSFIQNESVDRERMSLSTGAVDADKDGAAMIAQAGLGGRLYPHWLGRGEAFRLATATSMETPVLRAFQRYQNFWASVWSDMVNIVLTASEEYGGQSYETHEADVNTDSILQADMQIVTTVMSSLSDLYEKGLITLPVAGSSADQLVRVALGTLGIKNLDEVIGTARKFDDPSFEEPEFDPNDFAGLLSPDDSFDPFATDGQLPELAEAVGLVDYQKSVRALVYGYWGGVLDHFQFVDGMVAAISRYMMIGWLSGMNEVGIKPDEMTDSERAQVEGLINSQFEYILGFADAIEAGSKANGGALAPLLERAGLWTNRYNEARNTAMVTASNDPKLRWVSEKQNCSTCKGLHGKVKRASYWDSMGIHPQSPPNAALECGGWNCGCHFENVPDEPLSKGYLPGVRTR